MNTDHVEKKEQVEKVEQEESQSAAETVDLNRVFNEEERDLNSMFPDRESVLRASAGFSFNAFRAG